MGLRKRAAGGQRYGRGEAGSVSGEPLRAAATPSLSRCSVHSRPPGGRAAARFGSFAAAGPAGRADRGGSDLRGQQSRGSPGGWRPEVIGVWKSPLLCRSDSPVQLDPSTGTRTRTPATHRPHLVLLESGIRVHLPPQPPPGGFCVKPREPGELRVPGSSSNRNEAA